MLSLCIREQTLGRRPHPRRIFRRLLGVGPAAALLSGLLAVSAGPLAAPAAAGTAPAGPLVFWGDNSQGEADTPVGLHGVTAVAGGNGYTLALKSDGTVAAWGNDTNGQTNVPAGLSNVAYIAAGGLHNLALKHDGTVVAWGDNTYGESTVPSLGGVMAIAAGTGFSVVLYTTGIVGVWGYNGDGQQTIPPAAQGGHVMAIAAGNGHILALRTDHTVVAWGYNDFGEATVPTGLTGVTAIAAGGCHSLALKSDGTVVGWGSTGATVPAGLTGVKAIAAGFNHSLALKTDGTVVAWGDNTHGQTTVPVALTRVGSIAAGWQHSIAFIPATQLLVYGIANPFVAGASHSVTVKALDVNGNSGPGYRGTVHFTTSDNSGTVPADYTFTEADDGVHTFTYGVTLKTAGSQAVRATDTVSASITGLESGIVVTPASATLLKVSGLPSPFVAGAGHSATVTALDAYGNTATGYLGTVHFTTTDARAVLPADYTFVSGDAGVHKFLYGVKLETAGLQAVRARDIVTATVTGLQKGILVTPAAATRLKVSGLPSPYVAGAGHSVTVTAQDPYGNTATGYLGTIHFTSSDPIAVLPANYTFTGADAGVHQFLYGVTLKTAGTQSVSAKDTAAPISGTQSGIVVT